MSADTVAELADRTARATDLHRRARPYFAGPHALPLPLLRIIEAMLVSGASPDAWSDLAEAMRRAGCCLRALGCADAAERFLGLAQELQRLAENLP